MRRTTVNGLVMIALSVMVGGCIPAGAPRTPAAGATFRDCDGCPEMVVMPAGSFIMGSPEDEPARRPTEGPQHRVNIDRPFAVSKYEVTYDEYRRFVESTGHVSGQNCIVWTGTVGGKPLRGKSWQDPNFPQSGRHPVTCITWSDAQSYAQWLSAKTGARYDLLTEAQWEYAARSGTSTPASFTGAPGSVCDYANTADQSAKESGGGPDWKYAGCHDGYGAQTSPVGSYRPNPFGLYDMYGNVWEWTQDCYHPDYVGAPTDGSAWSAPTCSARVVRGSSLSAPPDNLRSAARSQGSVEARMKIGMDAVADFHNWNLGMRVARVLE